MENFLIIDSKGNKISAEFLLSFHSVETQKTYVIINNTEIVFSQDSAYNNLDVFEIIKEENNVFYVADIPSQDWEIVQNIMIQELFSKIP